MNSTKGKVGKGKEFFYKAFGATDDEYIKLLYMPEAMIIYRFYFEEIGMTDKWWSEYSQLTDDEKGIINPIIEANDFSNIETQTDNPRVLNVLQYYKITREEAEREMKK